MSNGGGAKRGMTPDRERMSIDFDDVVREHYGMILSFAVVLMGDPSKAEDLAQEVFVLAWRKLDSYDRSRAFGPWLRGMARNLARNAKRKRTPLPLDEETLAWLDRMHGSGTPDETSIWQVRLAALEACLEALPRPDRECLAMHYEQRRTYQQIGTRLGTSTANVKKKLYRLRRRLASCVEKRLEHANGNG